ncbi:PREDICTED: uncharacterized protein LOC104804805 [Tarenaya hassleriana]|uniref:uncharacterized protein LOC104804805 n=1 Tax=Tarenaya hassleriana TaxID=28532 RepID=UPI00053CA57A|nr:PREDICTED: uncharacterized protein LOC104804805 [Tarenaya hassleriana]
MEGSLDASLELHEIRSRVKELEVLHRVCEDEPEESSLSNSNIMVQDFAFQLETKVKQIVDEYSDVDLLGIEDSDDYLEYLRKELHSVEAESAKVSEEIERLSRTHVEDSNVLERDLEGLLLSLDSISYQDLEKVKENPPASCSTNKRDISNSIDENFKSLDLEDQIQEKRMILKSLEDLDLVSKRFDAVEQVEDALTGLKVLEFDGNSIRLQLQTYIPKLDGLFGQHKIDDTTEPSESIHELLIEIKDETLEIKKVEMFPNDVYIGDIIEATHSFRQVSLHPAVLQTRSPLQWFVGKVQERIILSTLRKYMVKSSNKSRHTFEYYDKEETIVAHMVGGVDAFLKVSTSWPLLNTPLKLVSIKNSFSGSERISSNIICKIEEMANSLDPQTQESLTSFVEAIEKILVEQTQ